MNGNGEDDNVPGGGDTAVNTGETPPATEQLYGQQAYTPGAIAGAAHDAAGAVLHDAQASGEHALGEAHDAAAHAAACRLVAASWLVTAPTAATTPLGSWPSMISGTHCSGGRR